MTNGQLSTDKPLKVMHFIWWIPHYRVPIFRRLSQNVNLNFTVCAGDNTQVPGGGKVASASDVGIIEGVNWRRLESYRVKGPIFRDYEWQPEAVKIVWKEKPDVVICLGIYSLSNWLVRLSCNLLGIPLIEWTQGIKRPERGVKWAVRKFYNKWAQALLLYGNFAREFFVSHGFRDDDVFVVNNSLDHEKQIRIRKSISENDIHNTRKEFGVSEPDDRLIFHSGRLEGKKKLPMLFDGLRRIKKKGRNVKLVLIGEGRDKKTLEELSQTYDIEQEIVFYGPCYDETVLGSIISASDLCVVPGQVGLIAMHSLVYGTPILTVEKSSWIHAPEVETVIEGQTGSYFRTGDIDHMVERMESLLYPIPRKKQMVEACMNMIDTYYTPEYQENVILEAVEYVIEKSRS